MPVHLQWNAEQKMFNIILQVVMWTCALFRQYNVHWALYHPSACLQITAVQIIFAVCIWTSRSQKRYFVLMLCNALIHFLFFTAPMEVCVHNTTVYQVKWDITSFIYIYICIYIYIPILYKISKVYLFPLSIFVSSLAQLYQATTLVCFVSAVGT